ncbi:MAG: hypothetical protein JO112_03225, partial [Planctomycetes bacterium]|nr:hypothetical protein [Planctomycetota bacterium]
MKRSGAFFIPLLLLVSALAGLAFPGVRAGAQPDSPAPPAEYKVEIRYQIYAVGNNRLTQFFQMVHDLEALGFHKDPGPADEAENPAQTRMTGTIRSANALKILDVDHVLAIQLMPAGTALPADPAKPVTVSLTLISGFTPERQRVLEDQVRAKLALLNFQEFAGYDNRGHTRMGGTIPAGQVPDLLRDLRWVPSGWLAPDVPLAQLPTPLRDVSPIVAVHVYPDLPLPAAP